jgi:DNA-binding MarR family transcriptional regulator
MNKNFLGDTIINLHTAIKTLIETEFSNIGIGYGQVNILMKLYFDEEVMVKQTALVKSLGIDKSNASRNILKLKEKGYIDVVLLNKRDKGITLSPKGKELKPRIIKILNTISDKMTKGISEEQATITNHVLQAMKGNLE